MKRVLKFLRIVPGDGWFNFFFGVAFFAAVIYVPNFFFGYFKFMTWAMGIGLVAILLAISWKGICSARRESETETHSE